MSLNLNITYEPILDYFESLYDDLKDKLDPAIVVILRKIGSNLVSANILIESKHYNEASIILRSATESVVLFCYLIQFPEKVKEYLSDCQMLKFKNSFISYKKIIRSKNKPEMQDIFKLYTDEQIIEGYESSFYLLDDRNKQKILTAINRKEFSLDDKIVEKLDKFFENKWKPFFMKLEKMYKDAADFKKTSIKLRDFLFENYNYASQTTHGEFFNWLDINKDKRLRIFMLHSNFKRIIITNVTILQDNGFQLNLHKLKNHVDLLEKMSDELENYFKQTVYNS